MVAKFRKATAEDFIFSRDCINEETIRTLFNGLMKWPKDFKPLRKVEKILQDKVKLFETEQKVDWATGELLLIVLVTEGKVCA